MSETSKGIGRRSELQEGIRAVRRQYDQLGRGEVAVLRRCHTAAEVALDGLYKVWPRNSMRIRPAKVKIMIGEPIYARDIVKSNPDAEDIYEIVTDRVKDTIAVMLAELRSDNRVPKA